MVDVLQMVHLEETRFNKPYKEEKVQDQTCSRCIPNVSCRAGEPTAIGNTCFRLCSLTVGVRILTVL